jgi:hypothetical protein
MPQPDGGAEPVGRVAKAPRRHAVQAGAHLLERSKERAVSDTGDGFQTDENDPLLAYPP